MTTRLHNRETVNKRGKETERERERRKKKEEKTNQVYI